jgi:xylose dehydrogenase (NAD/NADP)
VPVTWGVLSTAGINAKLLAGARRSDRVEVVAVASRDAARAAEYARVNGIDRAHGSYEALLADPGVEAVYIPLPNALHVEWAVRALEAGKHVLVEKPFDRRPEEVARAFDVAEREGRVLSEAFMWRHTPQTARLLELIRQGAIGRLAHVRAAFSYRMAEARWPDDIRLSRELDGGALMDVGCYCVSGVRLLAGEPLRVHAEQVSGASGVDLRLAAVLRMADDVTATFDCALVAAPRGELEAVGDEGSLFLDDPWHGRRPVIEVRRSDGVERIELPFADPYRLELENVSDAIRGTAPLLLGRDDAMGQAVGIEGLYRSAATGAPVALWRAASAG